MKVSVEYDYHKRVKLLTRNYRIPKHRGWLSPTYTVMLEMFVNDILKGLCPPNILLQLLNLVYSGQIIVIRHHSQAMDMLQLTPYQHQWVSIHRKENTLIEYAHKKVDIHVVMSHDVNSDSRGIISDYILSGKCYVVPLKGSFEYNLTCILGFKIACSINTLYRLLSVQHWIYHLIQIMTHMSWKQQLLKISEYMNMVHMLIPAVHNVHTDLKQCPSIRQKSILELIHQLNNIIDCYQLDTGLLFLHGNAFTLKSVLKKALSYYNQSRDQVEELIIDYTKDVTNQIWVGDQARIIQILITLFRHIHSFTTAIECHVYYKKLDSIDAQYLIVIDLTYCPSSTRVVVPWLYDRFTTGLIHAMRGRIKHESSDQLHRVRSILEFPFEKALKPSMDLTCFEKLKNSEWLILSPSPTFTDWVSALLQDWSCRVTTASSMDVVFKKKLKGIIVDSESYSEAEQRLFINLHDHIPMLGIGNNAKEQGYKFSLPIFHYNQCIRIMCDMI